MNLARDHDASAHMVGAVPAPLVTALHVFAARRESFDCIVRRTWSAPRAKQEIFGALPLEENGWDSAKVRMTHIGNWCGLYPIWRLERA